jgi:hypothetical protein
MDIIIKLLFLYSQKLKLAAQPRLFTEFNRTVGSGTSEQQGADQANVQNSLPQATRIYCE